MRELGKPLRILIADDHAPVRLAFRQDLETGGLEVVAEAASGPEAVAAALRERPDLCLLDVQMPENGISAIEAILRALPGTKVVLVTASPDEAGVLAAARAGADGYIAKDVSPDRLPHIMRAVAEGETAYPRRLLASVLRAVQSASMARN